MLTVYDSKGKSYELTGEIGRGGEGVVFSCADDQQIVAKIYHEPVSKEKSAKLRWMADNHDEHLLRIAAWIADTLHDAPNGKTVGFLMPNVKAKEIHELYSLKSRRVHFPDATWHFLVHVAANLARAFYSLHKNGHVMGDINHGNCVVLADGTVKLIDCDSYSISDGESRYPCEVGVTTHLAPELQGKALRDARREEKHDNFGLAVIVFQLLFLGRHPFAGIYLGKEEKSLEECIKELRFPYAADAHLWNVRQPPGTLSLSAMPPRIAAMFERAFLTEDRPEPREWVEALEDLSGSLKICTAHPGHHFYEKLELCPWCELESRTGLMLFPFISRGQAAGAEAFNVFTVENLISSLNVPQNLPSALVKPGTLPPPSPEIADIRKDSRRREIIAVSAHFMAMTAMIFAFGPGAACFGIFLMIFFVIVVNNNYKDLRTELNDKLLDARIAWGRLEENWIETDAWEKFNDRVAQVRQKISDYQAVQVKTRRKVLSHRYEDYRFRCEEFLKSIPIEAENISGIGPKRLAELNRVGIKTAADVKKRQYFQSIPGFSDALSAKLIDWVGEIEEGFERENKIETTEDEEKTVALEVSGARRSIERDIEMLVGALRLDSANLRRQQEQLTAKSESVTRELLQTESDLTALGTNTAAIVALILITFLMPMFGGIFTQISRDSAVTVRETAPPPPIAKSGHGSGFGSATGSAVARDDEGVYDVDLEHSPVPENITDREINRMTADERETAAETLYAQARRISDETLEHWKAEEKLRLALRLAKNDTKILNELGYNLYRQEKYEESLKVLKKSLKLYPQNSSTKSYIGMNYIRQEKFAEASEIFGEVTKANQSSFEGYFNLGLAHKGLGDHASAVKSFRKAYELRYYDHDARFELGAALAEIGNFSEAGSHLDFLEREKNTHLAQKLRNLIEK